MIVHFLVVNGGCNVTNVDKRDETKEGTTFLEKGGENMFRKCSRISDHVPVKCRDQQN